MTQEQGLDPIRRSSVVNVPVDKAFRVFTDEMSTWWPLETHSVGEADAETCIVEAGVGGRIYERLKDGREIDWGRVVVWDPPVRVVWAWQPNPTRPASTELEVRFIPQGDTATRVELEHRGWERLGDAAPKARHSYETDWPLVFGRYVTAASAVEGGQATVPGRLDT